MPARGTIILDMDETLIHTLDKPDSTRLLVKHPELLSSLINSGTVYYTELPSVTLPSGTYDSTTIIVVKRPGVDEFLADIRKIFDHVVIWSAGQREYVELVLDGLFDGKQAPDLILTANDVEYLCNGYHKPLRVVYARLPGSDYTNSVIVDDIKENFRENVNNGILIRCFEPDTIDLYNGMKDNELSKLSQFLASDTFSSVEDVRMLGLLFILGKPTEKRRKRSRNIRMPKPTTLTNSITLSPSQIVTEPTIEEDNSSIYELSASNVLFKKVRNNSFDSINFGHSTIKLIVSDI